MSSFFQSFFSAPGMLLGTLTVSVPIIIYLINRQRFRRRKWAAMEFLLRAMRKNRRRLQLENLLLLLIRCAVLFLLALAMARPFVRGTPIGGLSDQPENWIFVLDSSYSMNAKSGTQSLFHLAQEASTRIVEDLVDPGDRVAVVAADRTARVIVPPTQVTDRSVSDILRQINDLKPGHDALNVAGVFQQAFDVAQDFESPGVEVALSAKKLMFFSDFQRRDWLDGDQLRDPQVRDLLRQLRDASIELRFAELRGSDRNLGVIDLNVEPSVVSRDVWVELRALIKNQGSEDYDAVEIAFFVDGVEERTGMARIGAGESVLRTLPYRFSTSGHHSVSVEVRGDGLVTDNRRWHSVQVLENADVLLVDGDPGATALDRETLFLQIALLPDDADDFRRTPYEPVFRTVDQAIGEDLQDDRFVAVVLANVAASDLPEHYVDSLRSYVRQGGALMVFPGDRVIPSEYNQVFRRQDPDLLPLEMLDIERRDDRPSSLWLADPNHPGVQFFLDHPDHSYLSEAQDQNLIEFARYVRYQEPLDGAPVSPIMRFTDPDQNLAFFDAPLGEGRVLWGASSADDGWNQFPKWQDFIPFVHEAIPYLIGFGRAQTNLNLGEPIRQIFDASDYATDVSIIPPRQDDELSTNLPATLAKSLTKLEDDNRFMLLHEETYFPGLYRLRMKRPSAPRGEWTEREMLYAVNLDPSEGDLKRVSSRELIENFPDVSIDTFDAMEKVDEISRDKSLAGGTELWRHVLWIVLALLVVETILAHLFGRRQH